MNPMTALGGMRNAGVQGRATTRRIDILWAACSLIAAGLMLVASFLPLWRLELVAPQYPKGLFITSYGYKMTGDITEVNNLNHYVGLKGIDPDDVFELKMFPFGMAASIAVILAGAYWFQSWKLRALSVLAAWVPPLFMLADIQYWLYNYGHDISPEAALTIEPFTPKVIGTTRVMNFHSVTEVTPGFWLMVAAAVLLLAGPKLARWLYASWKNTGSAGVATSATILLLAVIGISDVSHARAAEPGTIAAAIAGAAPGETIHIGPGTYQEQLVINKPLALVGEGRPVIDGGRRGDVIVIAAEGVTLRGFTIQGSGRAVSEEPAGIRVQAGQAVIEDNQVRDVLYGVVLDGSHGHTLRDNTIESIREFPVERRGHALYLHNSSDNVIENNLLTYAKDGLYVEFSEGNTIRNNRVERVRYGIHFMFASHSDVIDNSFVNNINGGVLMYSTGTRFVGNELAQNRSIASGYGLMFKDVDDIELTGNRIHHNRLGLALEGSPFTPGSFVLIRDNLIGYNDTAVGMFTTTDVTFTGNTFTGNLRQIDAVAGSIEHKNRWSLDGRGNYWDDYQGYDANGDGIGDLTYRYQETYDALVEKNEALRAYDYTPARMALDLATRWFPVYRPEPRAVDPAPLMAPTMRLRADGAGQARAIGPVLMVLLVSVPVGGFWWSVRSARRRWQQC